MIYDRYEMGQYRAARLHQDDNDRACYKYTYVLTDGLNIKIFKIPSNANKSDFHVAFEQAISVMEKEKTNAVNQLKEKQMTREDAIKIAKELGHKYPWYEDQIRVLEALGLIKFDEPQKPKMIFEMDERGRRFRPLFDNLDEARRIYNLYGTIRLEEWSEGLVLWVGGEIVYKSWEEIQKVQRIINNLNNELNRINKILAGEIKIKVHSYDHNVDVARGRIIND